MELEIKHRTQSPRGETGMDTLMEKDHVLSLASQRGGRENAALMESEHRHGGIAWEPRAVGSEEIKHTEAFTCEEGTDPIAGSLAGGGGRGVGKEECLA